MLPLLVSYLSLEPSFSQAIGGKELAFNGTNVELGTSLSFLFTLGVMVCVLAGGVMYMRAGAIRIKASEQAIRKSNEEIKRITLGLLGVLSLFVIIYTLNKDLLNVDVPLKDLRANTPAGVIVSGSTSTSTATTTTGSPDYQARLASHNAVVARLAPSNIHTNHGDAPCTEAQFSQSTPSCTSLAYLPEETIQMLLALNGSCGCTLVISGGTEPGHVSHGENKRPVDLQKNDQLYSYIKSIGSSRGETSNCYASYVWRTFTFCDEKPRGNSTWAPHFHVG